MRKPVWLLTAGLVMVLTVVAGPAAGGEGDLPRVSVAGKDFRICGPDATFNDSLPAVVWNGTAGQYLVVWMDARNSATTRSDIYGRRLLATGTAVKGEPHISGPDAAGWDFSPDVTWNATDNDYLVVWSDGRNSAASGMDIYGRWVTGLGRTPEPDFPIGGPSAIANDGAPAVAWNGGDNEYLVVWQDGRSDNAVQQRGTDIYGRRVSAAGEPLGDDFRISGPNATADDWAPAVAWNGTLNEYLVVWQDERSDNAVQQRGIDIYGRRVSAAGEPMGGDFRISGPKALSDEWPPAVAWNGTDNQYLVVWPDRRDAVVRGKDIYGRRVSAMGSVLGGDFRISGPKATSDEYSSDVAWNAATNEYLVVWEDLRNDPTRGHDIYGRPISAAGTPLGGELRIAGSRVLADESTPRVAWNGTANEYLVVWADHRNSVDRSVDIYGRLVAG